MRNGLGLMLLAFPVVIQGCVLDLPPSREPLDRIWYSRMLASEYGQWEDGEGSRPAGRDEVDPWPLGAVDTRYGIRVSAPSVLGGGGWSLKGGLLGRVERAAGGTVELFGKEGVRLHGLKQTMSDRDRSYTFFLVVRPGAMRPNRAVREWQFSREELTLSVAPRLAERLQARYSGAELEKAMERSRGIFVEGFLVLDEQSKIATVTITGLVKPFQERVDLSEEL